MSNRFLFLSPEKKIILQYRIDWSCPKFKLHVKNVKWTLIDFQRYEYRSKHTIGIENRIGNLRVQPE